jgi:hypothetical protein
VARIHADTANCFEHAKTEATEVFPLFPPLSPVPKFFIPATYYVVNVHLRQSLAAVALAKEDAGNSGFGCGWPRWEIRGSLCLYETTMYIIPLKNHAKMERGGTAKHAKHANADLL